MTSDCGRHSPIRKLVIRLVVCKKKGIRVVLTLHVPDDETKSNDDLLWKVYEGENRFFT